MLNVKCQVSAVPSDGAVVSGNGKMESGEWVGVGLSNRCFCPKDEWEEGRVFLVGIVCAKARWWMQAGVVGMKN